jgi:DNA-binding NtrC family response regulator
VVAATNANLEEKVADGTFRDDLYYRLNVFPVVIPPLRERKDDIPLLAEHFLHKYASIMNSEANRFTPEALDMLKDASWRGNVRELENTIERAIILSEGDTIEQDDISPGNTPGSQSVNNAEAGSSEGQALEQISKNAQRAAETKEIKRVLAITGGNKSKAAKKLKVSYKTLLTKIKDYEIS